MRFLKDLFPQQEQKMPLTMQERLRSALLQEARDQRRQEINSLMASNPRAAAGQAIGGAVRRFFGGGPDVSGDPRLLAMEAAEAQARQQQAQQEVMQSALAEALQDPEANFEEPETGLTSGLRRQGNEQRRIAAALMSMGRVDEALKAYKNASDVFAQVAGLENKLGGDPVTADNERVRRINEIATGIPALNLSDEARFRGILARFPDREAVPEEARPVWDTAQAFMTERNRVATTPVNTTLYTPDSVARYEETGDRRALQFREDLSDTETKKIFEYSEKAQEARGAGARARDLAVRFEQAQGAPGGIAATVQDALAGLTGEEDAYVTLRRAYRGLRNSQAIANLPPGTASESDVQMALEEFPPPNATPEVLAAYLRNMERMAALQEQYFSFASDYLGEKKSPVGLDSAWREFVKTQGPRRGPANPLDYQGRQ